MRVVDDEAGNIGQALPAPAETAPARGARLLQPPPRRRGVENEHSNRDRSMTYLLVTQDERSYLQTTRGLGPSECNVGRVLLFDNPPASSHVGRYPLGAE